MVTLTTKLWADIQKINRQVNEYVTYLGDMEHYKKIEHWSFPENGLGDCEDYAIAKRTDLEDIGVPSFFACCWCFPNKEGYHCVLLIDTDRGTLVLDNRDNVVWSHDKLDYDWDKREMEDGTWQSISA